MTRWKSLMLTWVAAKAAAGAGRGRIHVALHAQSNFSMHGWVAGSEVTTDGLKRAFEGLDRVQSCQVFAPFSYDGLSSRKWDLVVVEGFSGSVPAFIHEVRAGNEGVVVLFFCLDTYPSLPELLNLDVDGFLTNSRSLLPLLQQIAPASSLIHLAADPTVMHEVPFHPATPSYGDVNVVYLGQFKDTKHRLVETLTEVAPLGLSIYGNGWGKVEELLPYWRGILPLGDIALLYTSAKVVLSTTETFQRSLGMVNNRVFEALSCGAAVVSDAFPAMEDTFGDHVLYYRDPGDAARAVEFLLENATARSEMGRRGRELILSKHTYASRVQSILSTMGDVLALRLRASSPLGTPTDAEGVAEAGSSTEAPAEHRFRSTSPEILPLCSPTRTGDGGVGGPASATDSNPCPSKSARKTPSSVSVRPNAPTVLVVHRSDSPPPEEWRRDFESAVAAVAGGVRLLFMAVGAGKATGSPFFHSAPGAGALEKGASGRKQEEASRLELLQARLARLLAGAEADLSGAISLGDAAASEGLGFMQWCCSTGIVAVYASVGDPLERQFLRHLTGEGPSRVMQTAFFTADSLAAEDGDGIVSPWSLDPPQPARRMELTRYEWVEQVSKVKPCREPPASEGDLVGGPCDEETRRDLRLRLKKRVEQAMFGVPRYATISILDPRDGALVVARRRPRGEERSDGWAKVDLLVKVDHPFFRTPDDGMWCVLLDGVEVGCRGDADDGPAKSTSSLRVSVEVDPRALPRPARLEAVLRGGNLEAPPVVSRSPLVPVTLWLQDAAE